ncbi:hypothetical protein P152DRAFT_454362 [Eremomyces bilateralis CBS 781.70]|uniref:Rhodopsin domain-containing protein n=1 Tax=Eremomyces bilateralis CBS 781.70 TaxID=1392243 RepID=A0A6G1GDN1_9PEZI|nr:uncharacterized protein P152DRAFT_454362 [Eremomyces bilateralis CBS 781.70]KAF1816124.1 hypothetical protein P152DRAFT_454362 [Eremomyces bilateralis CBS 781.70]
MADSGIPFTLLPDESKRGRLLATATPLFAIALLTYIGRMYTRLHPVVTLRWDDFVMSLSVVLTIIHYGLIVHATNLGAGRHFYYLQLPQLDAAGCILFIMQMIWIWCITFVKFSVALMLYRTREDRPWRLWLSGFMGLLVAIGIVVSALQLGQCRPIRAFWNPFVPGAKCWSKTFATNVLHGASAFFLATDLVLSLLPLTFILKLRRPRRDKIVIGCLMGLGLIASAASLVKILRTNIMATSQDPIWDLPDLALWAWIELYLGIMAACIPCLKAPFEKLLKKTGLLTTGDRSQQSTRTGNQSKGYVSVGPIESGLGRGKDTELGTIVKQHEVYIEEYSQKDANYPPRGVYRHNGMDSRW